MRYEIIWTGKTLPSKKNSKQFRVNRKTGARFISSSDKYHQWEDGFVADILSLRYSLREKKIKVVTMVFSPPDRKKFDLDNKASSLLDALVKAGFLYDDNYEYVPELTLKFGAVGKEWKVEMTFETE